MKTYQIHLIRHGLTDGNLSGKYIGRTDLPLCDEGKKQLYALCERYDYPHADAFFVGSHTRCQETLNILYPNAVAIDIAGFRECNFGVFEEKNAQELNDDPDFNAWISGGGNAAPPNGESGADFIKRTCETFEKVVEGLLKTGTSSSVIVASGGTIMAILAQYGLPRAQFYDWATSNGSGYSIRIQPRLWMSDRLVEVYDTIPPMSEKNTNDDPMVEIAREAAKRAFENTEEG